MDNKNKIIGGALFGGIVGYGLNFLISPILIKNKIMSGEDMGGFFLQLLILIIVLAIIFALFARYYYKFFKIVAIIVVTLIIIYCVYQAAELIIHPIPKIEQQEYKF